MQLSHTYIPTFLYRVVLTIKKNILYVPIFAVCLLFSGLPYAMVYGTWIQTIVISTVYFVGVLGLKTFCESTASKADKAWKKMLLSAAVLLLMMFCLQFLPP